MSRPTDWIDSRPTMEVASGSQSIDSLMTGVAPVNMRGMTVIRTIIRLGLFSNSVAGAWGVQRVDLGIGIASQEAFAAGVLPDPSTATDKPPRGWVWRSSVLVSQNGVGGQVVFNIEADIRGARKVENGEMYLIADNLISGVGATFQVNVFGLIRQLYKL